MKYAIVESGGKQYIAREGETIEVDRLPIEVGKSITFKEVLLVVDNGTTEVGSPVIKGVSIKGTVLAEYKAPKIIVFKYIPKERYRRRKGHRQRYTRVLIDSITTRSTGQKTETKEAETESKPAAQTKTAEKSKPTATKTAPKPKPTAKKAAAKPAAKKTTTTTTKSTSTAKSKSMTTTKAKSTKSKSSTTKPKSSAAKSKSSEKKSAAKPSTAKKSSAKSSSKSGSSKAKSEK